LAEYLPDAPGAPSHLSRDTLFLARENNIDFLMFSPHTTHLLQPLDVRVLGSRKLSRMNAQNVCRKTKRTI